MFGLLGIVPTFTIKARVWFKGIYKHKGQNWDTEIPQPLDEQFLIWSESPLLSGTTIPRSYFIGERVDLESYVFGDSSQDVFVDVPTGCY